MLIDFHKPPTKAFELTLPLKDVNGDLTGKFKTYRTDSAYKLWEFHQANMPKRKKRKKKMVKTKGGRYKAESLPNKDQADQIMKSIHNTEENKNVERN